MEEYIKQFIGEYEDLIEENEWEEIYNILNKEYRYNQVGQFTWTLLKSGINPLRYLKYVPENFLAGSDIEQLYLPEGITEIRNAAFYKCQLLTKIELPDTLEKIGPQAFHQCDGLRYIYIPDSVVKIDLGAFSKIYNTIEVSIDEDTEISIWAFEGSPKLSIDWRFKEEEEER